MQFEYRSWVKALVLSVLFLLIPLQTYAEWNWNACSKSSEVDEYIHKKNNKRPVVFKKNQSYEINVDGVTVGVQSNPKHGIAIFIKNESDSTFCVHPEEIIIETPTQRIRPRVLVRFGIFGLIVSSAAHHSIKVSAGSTDAFLLSYDNCQVTRKICQSGRCGYEMMGGAASVCPVKINEKIVSVTVKGINLPKEGKTTKKISLKDNVHAEFMASYGGAASNNDEILKQDYRKIYSNNETPRVVFREKTDENTLYASMKRKIEVAKERYSQAWNDVQEEYRSTAQQSISSLPKQVDAKCKSLAKQYMTPGHDTERRTIYLKCNMEHLNVLNDAIERYAQDVRNGNAGDFLEYANPQELLDKVWIYP